MRINAYATPHDILSGDLDGAAAVHDQRGCGRHAERLRRALYLR